jgi:hypothetical protein
LRSFVLCVTKPHASRIGFLHQAILDGAKRLDLLHHVATKLKERLESAAFGHPRLPKKAQ